MRDPSKSTRLAPREAESFKDLLIDQLIDELRAQLHGQGIVLDPSLVKVDERLSQIQQDLQQVQKLRTDAGDRPRFWFGEPSVGEALQMLTGRIALNLQRITTDVLETSTEDVPYKEF